MLTFLGRRLAMSLLTLSGIVVITFFLARLTGNASVLYLPFDASAQMIANFNHQHGFDLPVLVQFGRFVRDLVHLDFGMSLSQQRPAAVAVFSAMPITFELMGLAVVVMLLLSVTLGSIAALRPFSKVDNTITFIALGTTSLPDFWLALVGILIFAVYLGLVPTSGTHGAAAWILPLLTLSIPPTGSMIQVSRGAMIEALNAGYVQNARARGYRRPRLAFRHALRNAALPIVTVAGDRVVHLLNGTIIVGAVFAFPGIGSVIMQAVLYRDFPLLQASVFITGATVIILNLLIDIAYTTIDPRVRIS
ncbi:MAG TPA: ABC transporter permease [Spirochaetia bacterium]|nr:ABC transporter permease [Spirochaetia bacterium]